MKTREEVTESFRACRRAAGRDTALGIVAKFGESIDDVPADKFGDLIRLLDQATAKAENGGEDVPESIRLARAATLDPRKVYARWNSVGQRRAARGAKAGEP